MSVMPDEGGSPLSNSLGNYLKDRRAKLDPAAFGFPSKRRRTPGLRREVAQRANVSVTWWNRAAAAVLTDYGALAADQRNILRLIFSDSRVRALQLDWESVARFVVAAFRADVARAGASTQVQALVDELSQVSLEFKAMWAENDVRTYGGGTKHLRHPQLGLIALEYSSFAVDGQPDLTMLIYNPATPADAERVRALIKARYA
jgi:hypothetical protein